LLILILHVYIQITAFVDKVTTEIQTVVARLQEIGVDKVIVNNLFPVGCAPSQTRPSNHTTCEEQGNQGASLHNKYLGDKLADKEGVLVLDISAAFTEIIGHHGDGRGELAHKFGHKLTPCCESVDPKGYCGQRAYDEYNEIYSTYSVCDEPNGYFFWDDMNPTQAGWAAVMGQLETPIKEFLDLD
jgi:phospholipase/lecithinase/hemolysin